MLRQQAMGFNDTTRPPEVMRTVMVLNGWTMTMAKDLADFSSILLGTGFGEQTIRLGAKLRWLADQQHRRVVLPALCVRLLNELATSLFKVVSCPADDRQNIRIRKHLGEAVGA